MSFEINICPLCQKAIFLRADHSYKIYSCQTQVEWKDITKTRKHSHYEVETAPISQELDVQRAYILPYAIDSFANKSRLYKLSKLKEHRFNKWQLIKELPLIKIDTEENLLNRIHKLLLFL
jgi:hypothetical protein